MNADGLEVKGSLAFRKRNGTAATLSICTHTLGLWDYLYIHSWIIIIIIIILVLI